MSKLLRRWSAISPGLSSVVRARGELHGKGQPIEAAAHLDDGSHRRLVAREVTTAVARPVDEEAGRRSRSPIGIDDGERAEAEHDLTGQVQRLAARREHTRVRAIPSEHCDESADLVEQVLAVVEHEHHASRPDAGGEALDDRPARLLADAARRAHRQGN